jgi:hypothetical protein
MDLKLPGLQSTGWQSVHARSSRPNRGTHAATHQGMRLFGRPMTAPSPAKTAVLDASRTGDSPGGERPATATENTSAFQPLQHTSEHLMCATALYKSATVRGTNHPPCLQLERRSGGRRAAHARQSCDTSGPYIPIRGQRVHRNIPSCRESAAICSGCES